MDDMNSGSRLRDSYASRVKVAENEAATIAQTEAFGDFVEVVRRNSPWRFERVNELERYLHNVDHHLRHFVPHLLTSLNGEIRTVFDFGCGSGSGSIALAMLFPEVRCHGMDISATEVSIAQARARLYGVEDRCRFEVLGEGQALPLPSNAFDLCICCSVLEYVTAPAVRKLCVQEMARIVAAQGMLFMSIPNRLSPVEIHSRKLGWNYFPRLLKAKIVGSSMWEVKMLARPHVMKLCRTPWHQLFTPWTNFGLRKESD
jgi:ubiquinone/menaquinone biosynthesis C-methylase UbiE